MCTRRPEWMCVTDTGDKRVLSVSIAEALEADIIAGRLKGGERIDETAVAARFGVSRTPVREALQLVVARALAERLPYRGVVVGRISRARIDQLFEAMGEIEALCARFAAQRMTMEERAELLRHHEAMGALAAAGDLAGYEAGNTAFHRLIYRGAHNADLEEIAGAMWLKLAPFRRSQLADAARMARSDSEHAQIVEAIAGRDAEGAERTLRRHLVSAAEALLAKWTEVPAAAPVAGRARARA